MFTFSSIFLAVLIVPSHQQRSLQCLQDTTSLSFDPLGNCVLEHLDNNHFDLLDQNLMQPNRTSLELVNASFGQFGSNHFQALPLNVTTLILRNGNIPEVYFLSDTLTKLIVWDTKLKRFFVGERENEVLKSLEIRSTFLNEVPFSIEYLKGLKHLSLRGCNLTIVVMSMFEGLNLITLDLAENKIVTMEVDAVVQMPMLEELFIEDNSLSIIDNFPKAFPRLKTVSLFNNKWNCAWVSKVRARFIAAWIVVHGSDTQCDKLATNNGGLCCYRRVR